MRARIPIAAALVTCLAGACVPGAPTRTARPEVRIAPWVERTVRSEATCAEYRYYHLDGPSPGAPRLLLLPGGFYDARIFLNMAALAGRFEVIALDWPDATPRYTGHVGDYGEIAADFLAALGIRELYVGGVSMGTYAAIDLVSRRKELDVKGLFLASSVMFGITEEEVKGRTRRARMGLRLGPERMRALVEYGVGRAEYEEPPGGVRQLDVFWVRPYSYYYQVFTMTLNQGAATQATREIACPVLILHGDEDEVMPVGLARLSPTVFPRAEYVELAGAAHSMIFSRGPAIARAVLDFFGRE